VLLCAVLAAASALAIVWPSLRAALLALDLLALAAVLLDYWRTPDPERIPLARTLPLTAGLSTPFVREVRVGPSPDGARLSVELHEEFPPACEVLTRSVEGREAPPVPGNPAGGPDAGRLGP
jgi:hypothetical protein